MFQSIELFVGKTVEQDILIRQLIDSRYERSNRALKAGEFSQRGGIVEIYPVDFDAPVRVDFDDNCIRSIASVNIRTGKSIGQHKIVIILPNRVTSRDIFNADVPLNNFIEIQKGDYVVHNYHGIGRYLGIERVDVDHQSKEHMVIQYQGQDKLFVPVHDMHLVQKYVGFHKKPPRLYPLGGEFHNIVYTF